MPRWLPLRHSSERTRERADDHPAFEKNLRRSPRDAPRLYVSSRRLAQFFFPNLRNLQREARLAAMDRAGFFSEGGVAAVARVATQPQRRRARPRAHLSCPACPVPAIPRGRPRVLV